METCMKQTLFTAKQGQNTGIENATVMLVVCPEIEQRKWLCKV